MADNIMKLGLILSATDKMSRVIDAAVGKSSKSLINFQKKANAMAGAMQKNGTIIAAAGAAMTGGLFASVQSISQKAKTIQLSSQKIGMNAEVFQKYSGFANKMGLEVSSFEVAMGKLSKTQILAAMGNKSAAKIFKMSGLSIYDVTGKLKNSTMLVDELANKFSKTMDGPKKTALAMMLFGKAGKDMIPMLNKGSTAIKNYGLMMDQYGVVLTDQQLKSFQKYRDAMGRNNMAMLGVKTIIATSILPVVIKWAQTIATISKKVIGWTKTHQGLTKSILAISAVSGALLLGMGTFLIVAGTVMKSVSLLSKIFQAAKFAIFAARYGIYSLNIVTKAAAIASKIAAAAQWLWNAALTANPIGIVIGAIGALVGGIVICWKKFAAFRAVIKTTWETVKGFGGILKDYIIDRVKGIITGLGSMGKAIGLLFHGKFNAAFDAAKKGVRALSGYDAKLKATTKTKQLATKISGTYTTILAKEREADKPKSIQLMQSHASNIVNNPISNSPAYSFNYDIKITSGSTADKESFAQLLEKHKRELAQMLNKIDQDKKRLAYI